MRKMRTNKLLAATSLALTVAAFGCSTNRYPGNGEPTITTPGYGAANQAVMPGSSSGTEGNPPMASSYIGVAQPNVDAIADRAAAAGYQGRVLGTVNPGGVQTAIPVATGAVVPPAMLVNPQSTINATVSSPNGDQGVTGGIGVGGGLVVAGSGTTAAGTSVATGSSSVATSAAAPIAVTGALGVGATPANGTVVPASSATSPTVSGTAPLVTNGVVATTTPTATANSMAVTNAINVGATPASGAVVAGSTLTSIPVSALSTTSAARTTTTSSSVGIPVTSGLRIGQNSNGQIVVSSTKASTATATAKGSTSSTPSVKP